MMAVYSGPERIQVRGHDNLSREFVSLCYPGKERVPVNVFIR